MTTASAFVSKQHITSTPGVCGGKPCISGTRIRVTDIYVWHELQGQSPDQIVRDFPHLTLSDVYAALSYFWDNRERLLAQIEEERRVADQMKTQHPSKLADKLAALRANGSSIPS